MEGAVVYMIEFRVTSLGFRRRYRGKIKIGPRKGRKTGAHTMQLPALFFFFLTPSFSFAVAVK